MTGTIREDLLLCEMPVTKIEDDSEEGREEDEVEDDEDEDDEAEEEEQVLSSLKAES